MIVGTSMRLRMEQAWS